ncbi:glycoside hydrolase family 131 protein, partial [Bipolaris oryzae ATCC 44560]
FDGRIPQNFTGDTFETVKSPFNPKYVLGQNQTWKEVISFPNVEPSMFDRVAGTKPIEVEITDRSIFASSSEGRETALRRAELLVNGKNQTVSGKVTWLFSMRTSPYALNLSHEYLLAFHEAQDFQADFWSLKVGLPMQETLRGPNGAESMLKTGSVIYLQGWKWAKKVQTYFMAPFTSDIWHNFGLYLDFDDNQMQVAYSTGKDGLKIVTPLLANNISGKAPTTLGETHWGLQKRPVGANINNFLFEGLQPHGIRERLVIGGIL